MHSRGRSGTAWLWRTLSDAKPHPLTRATFGFGFCAGADFERSGSESHGPPHGSSYRTGEIAQGY
jgi:hypothetical protein